MVLLGASIDVSYVVVRLLAVLPWFAFILAVVAGVVLQLAAGYADSDTEQDEKRERVRPNPGVSSYSEFLRIAIYAGRQNMPVFVHNSI